MTEEDSFQKIKKGAKETGQGVEDTSEAVLDTAEGVKDAAEGVKEGVKETAEVFEESADKVTESDTYKRISEESKNAKYDENRDYDKSGGKAPMNPEDIASHEPTAVKRDKKQGTSGDP